MLRPTPQRRSCDWHKRAMACAEHKGQGAVRCRAGRRSHSAWRQADEGVCPKGITCRRQPASCERDDSEDRPAILNSAESLARCDSATAVSPTFASQPFTGASGVWSSSLALKLVSHFHLQPEVKSLSDGQVNSHSGDQEIFVDLTDARERRNDHAGKQSSVVSRSAARNGSRRAAPDRRTNSREDASPDACGANCHDRKLF